MPSLADQLLKPATRPAVVGACAQLVEDEVAAKGGFSGMAVKTAFMMVKSVKPDIVRDVVDRLLDASVAELEGTYASFVQAGGGDVQLYMQTHAPAVAEKLLRVADKRAASSENRVLKGAYDKLRASGAKHVEAAIPGLARVLSQHLQQP